MNDDHDANLDLPREMRDTLHELHRIPSVPRDLDDRILSTAHEGFARRQRTRLILRRTAAIGGAAVAAGIAIFFGVHALRTTTPSSGGRNAAFVAVNRLNVVGDVDGNGRVDIVDALALAKKLETGDVPWQSFEDLDHDGKVTKADVEQVAQLAVTLPDSDVSRGPNLQ